MSTEVTVSALPNCDICDLTDKISPAQYDARINHGPGRGQWAYLCTPHWEAKTNQTLGTGFGQKLKVASDD